MKTPGGAAAPSLRGGLPRSIETAALAALAGAVVSLHWVRWHHAGGLWRDEANSLALAGLAWREFWPLLTRDSFPALYPLLLRVLALDGDAAARTLGFLVGLGLALSMGLNARALGRRIPWLTLALGAASPVVILWGDSARAYGLGAALMALASTAIWRAAEKPSPGRTAAAAVLAVLSVQCLYQNLLFVAAAAAGGLAAGGRRAARPMLVAAGVSAASLLPYIPLIWAARDAWLVLRTPMSLGWYLASLGEALGAPLGRTWALWAALAGAAALRLAFSSRPRPRSEVFAATALAVGGAAFIAYLMAASLIAQPWYCLPLLAFGAPLLEAASPPLAWVRLILALSLAGLSWRGSLELLIQRSTNIDLAARTISRSVSPEDLVVIHPWYAGVSFGRYYQGPSPWVTLPPLEDNRIHRADLLKKRLAETDPLAPVLRRMRRTIESGGKVWLVGGVSFPHEPPPLLPPAPRGPAAWHAGPYLDSWSLQLGDFLARSGWRVRVLPPAFDGAVSRYENVRVLVFAR